MKGVPPDYSRLSRKGWRGEGGGVRKREGKKMNFAFHCVHVVHIWHQSSISVNLE